MCKYCEGKEDISDRVFSDGSKFSDSICRVRIYKSPIFGVSLGIKPINYKNGKKIDYIEYNFLIKFCPMCGRKLVEKEV